MREMFTMVCNAASQFQVVGPPSTPKLRKSADDGTYKKLDAAECANLQEAIDAINAFLTAGPNRQYVYDNFRAGSTGTAGTTIGASRFWLSSVGKELADATR